MALIVGTCSDAGRREWFTSGSTNRSSRKRLPRTRDWGASHMGRDLLRQACGRTALASLKIFAQIRPSTKFRLSAR